MTAVADGREAMAEIQRRLPEAAVLDVEMPYVDGLAVCRYLHALAPDVPVIVATALEGAHEHAVAAGADGVLAKPFAREELLAALPCAPCRRSASRAGRRDELARVTMPLSGRL